MTFCRKPLSKLYIAYNVAHAINCSSIAVRERAIFSVLERCVSKIEEGTKKVLKKNEKPAIQA